MTNDVEVIGTIDELVGIDELDNVVVGRELVDGIELVVGIEAELRDDAAEDDNPVNVTIGVKLENGLLTIGGSVVNVGAEVVPGDYGAIEHTVNTDLMILIISNGTSQ
jgi:hypothetical protein